MHHRPASFIDRDAIVRIRFVASQHQDHLQPRESPHEGAMRLAEARHALGRDKRKVHAGFQNEAVALGELIDVVALGVAHEVDDRARVFAHNDERGMAGETVTQPRQTPPHARAQQQGRRIHGARRKHHDLRVDLVIARLPRRRIALRARGLGGDARGQRLLADGQHLAARDHFHAILFGARQLHAVRALLGLIGTAQVAQARSAAAFDVHWELLHVVFQLAATLDEQLVVFVDEAVFHQVRVVFGHELPRAAIQVGVCEARHIPSADDALGRQHGCAGIHHRGTAIGATESNRHGAVGGKKAPAVFVERAGHLQLAAGELIVAQTRPFLQHGDAQALSAKRREFLRHRAAARAGAYDHDVVADALHPRASQPRTLAA